MDNHKKQTYWRQWLISTFLLIALALSMINCTVGTGNGSENPINNSDGGAKADTISTDSTSNPDKAKSDTGTEPTSPPDTGTEPTSPPDTGTEPTSPPDTGTEPMPEQAAEAPPEPPQPVAPQVVSTTPKDGESLQQPVNNPINITVVFDQEMDTSSFTQGAINIQPQTSGKVMMGSNNKTLTFIPDQVLLTPQKFTVTVTKTVLSKAGLSLAKPYTFSFSTTLKPGPPYLGAFSSAGGMQTGAVTHFSITGHNTAIGSTDGQGSHTVQNGFIYNIMQ